MEFAAGLGAMIGTWDSLALRLLGAAALAAGLHAWRQLHRARARGGRESTDRATEPLLGGHAVSLETEVSELAPSIAEGTTAGVAPSPAAGAPGAEGSDSQQHQKQKLEEQHDPEGKEEKEEAAMEVSTSTAMQPGHEVVPAATASAAHGAQVQQVAEAFVAKPVPAEQQHAGSAVGSSGVAPTAGAVAAALVLLEGQPSSDYNQPQQQQPPTSLPTEQPVEGAGFPPQQQPHDEANSLLPHAEAGAASWDRTAINPGALGSPFVPALLSPTSSTADSPGGIGVPPPAIPLFSTFVPPAPTAEPGTAAADVQPALVPVPGSPAAAAATPMSPGSNNWASSGGSPPRHRRRRSLLTDGFDQSAAPSQAALVQPPSVPDPQQQRQLDQKQLERKQEWALLEGQRRMRAELTAQQGAAAGSAGASSAPPGTAGPPLDFGAQAAAAGESLAGRPTLRVELPAELALQAEMQQHPPHDAAPPRVSSQSVGQPAHALSHFHSPPLQPEGQQAGSSTSSSRAATPLGFHQQQQADAEAAAAAAAAAWGTAQHHHQQNLHHYHYQHQDEAAGGTRSPDSVAAALQRAVHMAASGGAYPAGSTAGGLYSSSHPASSMGGGMPGAGGTRAAFTGSTFRSSSSSSQQGYHPSQAQALQGGVSLGLDHGGTDSAWGDMGGVSMLAERSTTLRNERHLPRLSEEVEGVRLSVDVDVPLACKLDVVAGPCSNQGYTNTEDVLEIIIGRNQGATMQLNDGEISGQHAAVRWSSVDKCWKVADLGSLNGTLLNGEPISVAGRKRGRDYRLSTDDILQLGSFTKIKVSTFPRDLLDPLQSRCGSLPVGSMPKSLTMPKHRIPSFSSLLSPKITNTPNKKASVAAASDELRLECCIVSRTGRDHQRKGQTCEDVACAECPLHGCDAALGPEHPAALFCVFDGHCGRGAADAASLALPDEVSKRLQGARAKLLTAEGAPEMLREAFLATDEAISAEEGCTATAVLMWRDSKGAVCLQAANVGDSAALWIDPEAPPQAPLELTEDHRLTNPRERQRLQDMGIQLASNARRLYGLNLCRGLGDKFLKDEDLGLSAEPHVSGVVRVSEQQGGILLIASDGLWDVADVEAVTQAVCQADREKDGNVLETASAVVAHALKQRTKDDVTALVVRVWPASEWELRSPTKNLDDGQVAAFVS